MGRLAFQQRVLELIHLHSLIDRGDFVLIAVSGGPDSTALLDALASLQPELGCSGMTVLHYDHGLRGSDSDADREFTRALAERYRLPFHFQTGDVRSFQAEHRGFSLEMAARECRHQFFRTAMKELHAHKIALGHSATDQAEEVLLRLFRGTGPSGLSGMRPATGRGIIRPLLFATRPEILDYLRVQNIPFRIDTSNDDAFCRRNALRLKVIPSIEVAFDTPIVTPLSRHASLAADEEDFWAQYLRVLAENVCEEEDSSHLALDLGSLRSQHRAVQRRLLRHAVDRFQGNTLGLHAVHMEILTRWIARADSSGTLHLPRGLRASIENDRLVFSKSLTAARGPTLPLQSGFLPIVIPEPGCYAFGSWLFTLRLVESAAPSGEFAASASHFAARMDASKISWPMSIRVWEAGDCFHPLGLGGTKKVQDFFTDAKIQRALRGDIPLLCDREKICWVVGHRLDDRVKLDQGTDRVLVVDVEQLDLTAEFD